MSSWRDRRLVELGRACARCGEERPEPELTAFVPDPSSGLEGIRFLCRRCVEAWRRAPLGALRGGGAP